MSNLFVKPNSNDLEVQYRKNIHEALYPVWNWTGGYIIANVFDNGKKVVLSVYEQPSPKESTILVHKIEKCLNFMPNIFWKLIGTDNEISLNSNPNKVTVQIDYNEKNNNLQQFSDDILKTEQVQLIKTKLTIENQITNQINSILMMIYEKANQDIETIKNIPNNTIQGLVEVKDSAFQYSQKGFFWVQENYSKIIDGSIQVIEPLKQELIKTTNPKNWITNFGQDINKKVTDAINDFNIIRNEKKGLATDKIATYIIIESLKKSTFSRLVDSGIYYIGKSVSDWLNTKFQSNFSNFAESKIIDEIRKIFEQPKTSDLMLAMIVQIACTYKRGDFSSPEKQGELISIVIISYLCSLAVDVDFADLRESLIKNIDCFNILQKMGIDKSSDIVNQLKTGSDATKKLNNLQKFFLSITINIVLFLLIGFIAKYIYQNYDKAFEILISINLFNQIKKEASQSVLQIAKNTNLLEDVIVECYQIEKIEQVLNSSDI